MELHESISATFNDLKSSSDDCLRGALYFHRFYLSSFKKLIFVLIFNGKLEAVTQPCTAQVFKMQSGDA